MDRHSLSRPVAGVFFLTLWASLLFCQCDRQDAIVGSYSAVDSGTTDRQSVTLDIQPNGKGLWSVETDNAPFRWDLRQGTIRLHTPSGGVIEGRVEGRTIRIDLPGTGPMVFTRRE